MFAKYDNSDGSISVSRCELEYDRLIIALYRCNNKQVYLFSH